MIESDPSWYYNSNVDILKELEAPQEDKSLAHYYVLTTEGEAVCMN